MMKTPPPDEAEPPAAPDIPDDIETVAARLGFALRAWHDLRLLDQSPLVSTAVVRLHLREAGRHFSHSAGLRSVLRDLIERMPELAARDGDRAVDAARRYQQVIKEVYFTRRPRNITQVELSLSKSTLYRLRMSALHALAHVFLQADASARAKLNRSPAHSDLPRLSDGLMAGSVLIGRGAVLAWIKKALAQPADEKARVVAVWGVPGVGKTRVLDRVIADVAPGDAFGAVIAARLGPRPDLDAILRDWADRLRPKASGAASNPTAVIRSALDQYESLIVLDDVWSAADALALMLGGPNSACLISTRHPAIAADLAGDHALQLGDLGDEDGVALLRALAPAAIAQHEPQAFALVKAVGGLPLALTLAGLMLRRASMGRNSRRIAAAWDELAQLDRRLQLTMPQAAAAQVASMPAAHVSLVSVIDASTDAVSDAARAALAALSAFPARPSQFGEAAALAVAACAPDALDELTEAGLIEAHPDSRYALHQSIAAYAQWRRGADTAPLQRLALHMADWLERHAPDFEQIEIEMPNVLAAAEAARACDLPGAARRIGLGLAASFEARGLFIQARRALAPVDVDGETRLWLGRLAWRMGDATAARASLRDTDDPRALRMLAWVEQDAGQTADAITMAHRAIAAAAAQGRLDLLPELVTHAMQLDGALPGAAGAWVDGHVDMSGAGAAARTLTRAECIWFAGDLAGALRELEGLDAGKLRAEGLVARRAACAAACELSAGRPEAALRRLNSLAANAAMDADDRARLWLWAGRARRALGQLDAAALAWSDGLRAAGAARGELLCELAELDLLGGRIDEAQRLAHEALAWAQRSHAATELAMALAVCGQIESHKGDFIAWRERFREAWALLAKAPSPWPVLRLLAWQAEAYDRHGDSDQARATREEMGRVREGVA